MKEIWAVSALNRSMLTVPVVGHGKVHLRIGVQFEGLDLLLVGWLGIGHLNGVIVLPIGKAVSRPML